MNAVAPIPFESDKALLPDTYKAARAALSQCSRVDECKDWADKAQALASYARQAKDETLRKLADRIQARASRRCGELLKQIPSATGINIHPEKHADLSSTRTQVAREAGMSRSQQSVAARLARIPEDQFESMVESDNPPTVTELSMIGIEHRRGYGADADLSSIKKFARYCGSTNATELAALVVSPDSKRELQALIGEIDSWLDQFITAL